MQLNTITELLDIPNYKVTHVIHNDGNRLHFIVEQIERLPPVRIPAQAATRFRFIPPPDSD